MKWRQVVPTAFTMVAMLAGFLSIIVTMEGIRTGDPACVYYRIAAQLIMLAMILDGIDGNVARALKGESEFGAELDTYVDMTAFGIAPAILIFAVTLQSESIWRIVLPSAVALSGVVRLARFKVKDPLRGQGGYAGLPITGNAGWVALFVFISQTPPYDRFSLSHGPVAMLFLLGIVVFISLQVTNVRYPKPTKKSWMFIPFVILVFLLFIPAQRFSVRVAIVILAMGLLYGVFGPLFVKSVEIHKTRREAARMGRGA
ncbi:MAG: CDP-alcohol phosphatidyltransferase family protein [Candidatus Pacebacteria bacterium]|nr:CDP-alcohol phosphatidyltransferase family protein [Candidatus Paceibacterota bacterium]